MAEGTMSGRERFIGRIASRLGRARPLSAMPEHPARGVPPHYAAIELSEQEKLELFTRNWTALTGRVKLVPRERAEQEIVAYIGELAAEFGISRIARWDEERLNKLGLDEGLRAKGLQVVPWREDGAASRETAEDAADAGGNGAEDGAQDGPSPSDPFHTGNWAKRHPLLRAVERCGMGIVWPDAVIANSGTLALFADPVDVQRFHLVVTAQLNGEEWQQNKRHERQKQPVVQGGRKRSQLHGSVIPLLAFLNALP